MWRDDALLLDIRIAASDACGFVEGLDWKGFQDSKLHQSAVVRCLEIIGEAAGRLSLSTRDAHPSLPWRDMINMRNRLIHAYDAVRIDVVWSVVQNDLPLLITALANSIPIDGPG